MPQNKKSPPKKKVCPKNCQGHVENGTPVSCLSDHSEPKEKISRTIKNFVCSRHGPITPRPKCPKCISETPTPQMDWEEEFDNLKWLREENRLDDLEAYANKIKIFIHSLLSKVRAEEREKILELINAIVAKNKDLDKAYVYGELLTALKQKIKE